MLYLVACGTPAAGHLPDVVRTLSADGWRVCVITTPMGRRFVDVDELQEITGLPVRSEYKRPDEPDLF